MKFLSGYFKQYKKQAIIGPLFKLLEAVFELIVPVLVAKIIDKGIAAKDFALIWKYVGLMGAFALIGYICALTAQYFASFVANNIGCTIRSDLFKHILNLKMADYDKIGSAGILTSLTDDVNQISNGINLFLRLLLRSPFIVAGACVAAFLIDFKASLIFVCVVIILISIIYFNMRITLPLFKKSRTALGNLSGIAENGLSGVKTIRSFNKSSDDFDTFSKQNSNLYNFQLKASSISAMLNPITYVVINLCICLLIYYGAIEVDDGVLSKGLVVALYSYMSQILIEVVKLCNLVVNVSKSLACLNKVEKLFAYGDNSSSDVETLTDNDLKNDICVDFKNVSFTYEKNSGATINDISFEIKRGEIIGIIGKTGSGKSTIARLLSGIYDTYNGSIKYFGKEIKNLSEKEKADSIGFVTQKTNIITGSIRDNIIINRSGVNDTDINSASRISCLEEVITKDAEGLNKMLYATGAGTGLSGGQKQRLGIARVLAGNPDLLILDDSTSALDANTESSFLRNLTEMSKDITTVIISQRIRTVKNCNKILYIDDGVILGFDTHENLYNKLEDYRNFCILQGQEMNV